MRSHNWRHLMLVSSKHCDCALPVLMRLHLSNGHSVSTSPHTNKQRTGRRTMLMCSSSAAVASPNSTARLWTSILHASPSIKPEVKCTNSIPPSGRNSGQNSTRKSASVPLEPSNSATSYSAVMKIVEEKLAASFVARRENAFEMRDGKRKMAGFFNESDDQQEAVSII